MTQATSSDISRSWTPQQRGIVERLLAQFELDESGIRFFPEQPDEPWLSAETLMSIARQSGAFQSIEETFDQFVAPLDQVIHNALVIDKQGRLFKRSGAAKLGETLPFGEAVDGHALASSRALNAALRAAGFHPLHAASVVSTKRPEAHTTADEATARTADLKQIHLLAEQKKLIKPAKNGEAKNMDEYREWLFELFGTRTVATLSMAQRASVIEALRAIPDEEDDESIA